MKRLIRAIRRILRTLLKRNVGQCLCEQCLPRRVLPLTAGWSLREFGPAWHHRPDGTREACWLTLLTGPRGQEWVTPQRLEAHRRGEHLGTN